MNTIDKVNLYRRLLRRAKVELREAASPQDVLEKVNMAERVTTDANTALFDLLGYDKEGRTDPDVLEARDLVRDAGVNLMQALHLLQERYSKHRQ